MLNTQHNAQHAQHAQHARAHVFHIVNCSSRCSRALTFFFLPNGMLNTRGFECSAGCQQFRATMCTCPSHSSGARYLIIVQFLSKTKLLIMGTCPSESNGAWYPLFRIIIICIRYRIISLLLLSLFGTLLIFHHHNQLLLMCTCPRHSPAARGT